MNKTPEIMAKLLLLRDKNTHDATELVNKIKTSADIGTVLDFRARCLNTEFLLENNFVPCQSETERASWLSQCRSLISECDKALQTIRYKAVIDWLSAQITEL